MSAYQLSENHIGAIARWAIVNNRGAKFSTYWQGGRHDYYFEDICRVLADECYRSVRTRYPEGDLPGPTAFPDSPVQCTKRQSQYADLWAVDVLKACKCYAYQACETDDWDQTEAHALIEIESIKDAAICALPGFEESPTWGINYDASEQDEAEAAARRAHHEATERHAAYLPSQH